MKVHEVNLFFSYLLLKLF